ncbi:2,3-bisphosphoglycerate-dependent phosphoglycerate mutase [Patescibacteria group bacterium]|nr:2,3-bisphosphoglycerate-dependent phosphoglycerate mutase [Patescibacteria group bacterium]
MLRNDDLPVYMDDTLNERYYGDLQGMNKKEAEEKYGFEQVLRWRRGYKDRPPKGESLKQVFERTIPYFSKVIVPRVKRGEQVLLAAHGNSLRTIIKHIEGINDEMIANIDLPQAKPIVYRYAKGVWKHELGDLKPGRPLR